MQLFHCKYFKKLIQPTGFSNDNMDEEFKFFVRNSNVEWSRLKFSDGSSVIGTLGEEGFDGTLGYFIKAKPDRLKQLTQFDHCHPNGRTMPSDADIDIVIDAQKISLNSIECKIYNSANTDEYRGSGVVPWQG